MERTSVGETDDLVPGKGTFLCSMQGGENWLVTLEGMFLPRVRVCRAVEVKICEVDFANVMVKSWLKHESK